MGIFYVDGRPVPFTEGDNILKAALEAKVEIPYFCFHPALGSLGACRLCAVKVFPPKEQQGQRPRVVMSCLQPARDGMRITVKDSDAKADHQGVIEFLMTNHPHDCPVCDEGGECHLQDMTVANGPPYRRFDGGKRTFLNQYLGPLVWHDMERCITCYRCVRFYQDYALGNDFGVMGSRNQVYFGRARNGTLESPFSGNLVEICPTGVFTDKVFRRHYSRVWDLETAPSICPHCSVGCNTLPGARAGTLRRVRNRFHPQLNRWFLCDRGRYGHRYTEHPHRPLQARVDGYPVATEEALMAAVGRLQKARGVALLGSCREDMATNTALQTLATRLDARFSPFLTHALDVAVRRAAALTDRAPTLVEMETADVVFVAGDLTGHAPMVDLAVRQALRTGARLFVLSDTPTSLARFAETVITTPAPAWAEHCKRLQELCLKQVSATGNQPLNGIAAALIQAKRPLFLGVAATLGVAGIEALAALAEAVPGTVMQAFALPGPNAFGAALLGSEDATSVLLEEVENGAVDTLLVVGEDPFGAALGGGCWRRLRNRIKTLIIIDCIPTVSTTTADILIPSAAWAERGGVFVNYEGRAQAFEPVFQRKEPCPSPTTVLVRLSQGWQQASGLVNESLLRRQQEHYFACREQQAGVGQLAVPNRRCQSAHAAGEPAELSLTQDLQRLLEELPQPGNGGVLLHSRPVPKKPRKIEGWRVTLSTWYGDDPLADFAPELACLKPPAGARMAPEAARAAGLEAGAELVLRGSVGMLRLPLLTEPGIAPGVIALSRAELAQLGLIPGDPLNWGVA